MTNRTSLDRPKDQESRCPTAFRRGRGGRAPSPGTVVDGKAPEQAPAAAFLAVWLRDSGDDRGGGLLRRIFLTAVAWRDLRWSVQTRQP